MYIDAHNHLQDDRLAATLDGVLARARAAGVERMSCCGTRPDDWAGVLSLAGRHPDLVIPSLGLHPWFVEEAPADWFATLDALRTADGVGIGEIGLDRALPAYDPARQEACFLRQYRLSLERAVPASLHCRKAWGRLVELLEQEGPHPRGFVLHAYSGPADLVDRLAVLGASFSFGATLAFPGNRRGRAAAAAVPPDRLLAETDAPDMLPPALRPADRSAPLPLNEPANVRYAVRALAEARSEPEAEVARRTAGNARRLFGAAPGPRP